MVSVSNFAPRPSSSSTDAASAPGMERWSARYDGRAVEALPRPVRADEPGAVVLPGEAQPVLNHPRLFHQLVHRDGRLRTDAGGVQPLHPVLDGRRSEAFGEERTVFSAATAVSPSSPDTPLRVG